jgi:hypothetical protein
MLFLRLSAFARMVSQTALLPVSSTEDAMAEITESFSSSFRLIIQDISAYLIVSSLKISDAVKKCSVKFLDNPMPLSGKYKAMANRIKKTEIKNSNMCKGFIKYQMAFRSLA